MVFPELQIDPQSPSPMWKPVSCGVAVGHRETRVCHALLTLTPCQVLAFALFITSSLIVLEYLSLSVWVCLFWTP